MQKRGRGVYPTALLLKTILLLYRGVWSFSSVKEINSI